MSEAGVDNARREAQWLNEAASDATHLAELVGRRIEGEPLQYLTGIAGFRRLELRVGPGVLIPRPETEIVTEIALRLLPAGGTIVDVGTGSGAIALAVADERPDARIYATDISVDALNWARRNRDSLRLAVELVAGDLFDALPHELGGTVDVVVSNPPYIGYAEAASLPVDVRDHEPEVALFAPEDGLSVVRRLAQEAPVWLRPSGHLVLEIAPHQANAVAELLSDYRDVRMEKDLTGRDRVAVART